MGKVPPQNIDVESAVLGALMIEKGRVDEVFDLLVPERFYMDAHQMIVRCILDLTMNKKPVDILTVTSKARELGYLDQIGGPYEIIKHTERVTSAANLNYHLLLVTEKWIARQMIHSCSECTKSMFDDEGDVFEKMIPLINTINMIQDVRNRSRSNMSWAAMLSSTMKLIEDAMNRETMITGITTGDRKLNEYTGGWQNGDMIVIGGRPSMGKTALALHFLKVAVKAEKKARFYSLEMSYQALAMRLLSDESEIDFARLKRGQITGDELVYLRNIEQDLAGLPITINDNPRLTIFDIAADARVRKMTDGLEMIVIDYIGLISPMDAKGKTKEQQVSEISREVKLLAKELNLPVIILAQLSRANEHQSDKRPVLSNLRDSGSIEQDADVVIFPYRPSYYTRGDQTKEPEQDYKELSQEEYLRLFETIIAKNRNGNLGTVIWDWDGTIQKFKSINY